MWHCPAFAKERKVFIERACKVQPGFDAMACLKQAEIMLWSDSPKLLNPHLYSYLILLYYSHWRQFKLRIPTVQEEGPHPRTSNTFFFVLQHAESGAGAIFLLSGMVYYIFMLFHYYHNIVISMSE